VRAAAGIEEIAREHRIKIESGKLDTGAPDSITDESWKDTTFVSLGATWKLDPQWAFRCGLAMDSSAVDAAHRTPRIPDNDRKWVSLGVTYMASRKMSVDVGYTRIFVSDGAVQLTASAALTDPNLTRGNLNGTIQAAINILGAQVRYTF
jgi:long-chain fatty acid transport protein